MRYISLCAQGIAPTLTVLQTPEGSLLFPNAEGSDIWALAPIWAVSYKYHLNDFLFFL